MTLVDRARHAVRHSSPWITGRRWYGDKARTAASLEIESVAPIDIEDLECAMVIARFSYDHGNEARYFVPIIADTFDATMAQASPVDLQDAVLSPAFLRWFVQGFEDERTIQSEDTWTWRRLGDDFPPTASVDFDKVKVISAEQSNTSIVFDDQFIGKIFRRLQAGENPDLEIGEFLTRDDRFSHSPKLYGLVDVEQRGATTAIAAIQEFIPNRGDGWSWLLGELEHMDAERQASIVDAVSLLGQRTGEMHVALASDREDPAFAPEEFTHQDSQRLVTRIIAEMSESVEGLVQKLGSDHVGMIHKGIGAKMADASVFIGSYRTRVHGDYHLGQTLRTVDDDFCLIDFEGEPSRTMEERRMKQSPLKDVAGMLRSLDYAAATMRSRTDDPARILALNDWLIAAQDAFVVAYRDAVGKATVNLVPQSEEAFAHGLSLLTLEKALYEVRYELNNRPDWLHIPLDALRTLAGVPAPDTRPGRQV